jgi:hypothetical protein
LNTLGQAETTLIAGSGSQSGGHGRWGDYSAMTVDPVDDCTFWYTTEYYQSTGNDWQTRIGSFKYPGCSSSLPGAFSKTAPTNGATGLSASPTLSWGTSTGATGYEYCYDTTNDNSCTSWTSAGTNTSLTLSGLSPDTTYYWQIRANNSSGTTYADGSGIAFWSFTTNPASDVSLAINPATSSRLVGQNFDLHIEVRAGVQPVDSAAAYLDFDPAALRVVSITAGTSLPNIVEKTFDNTTGQVDFSASTNANFPSGTFTLATVTFKAFDQTSGTSLSFNTKSKRKSEVAFDGSSVLKDIADGKVVVVISDKVFLPLLQK